MKITFDYSQSGTGVTHTREFFAGLDLDYVSVADVASHPSTTMTTVVETDDGPETVPLTWEGDFLENGESAASYLPGSNFVYALSHGSFYSFKLQMAPPVSFPKISDFVKSAYASADDLIADYTAFDAAAEQWYATVRATQFTSVEFRGLDGVFGQFSSDTPLSGLTAIAEKVGLLDTDSTIVGSRFNDRLEGGAGRDTIDGGGGSDQIVENASKGNVIDGNTNGIGGDILLYDKAIKGVIVNSPLAVHAGVTDTVTNVELIVGSKFGDTIVGSAGQFNDTFAGGLGNDTLVGGEGDDVLDGGEGSDTLWGIDAQSTSPFGHQSGKDKLTGGEGADTFVFSASKSNYTLEVDSFIKFFDSFSDDKEITAKSGGDFSTIADFRLDIDHLIMGGKEIDASELVAVATLEQISKMFDKAIEILQHINKNSPVPNPAGSTVLDLLTFTRDTVMRGWEVTHADNPYRELFIQSWLVLSDAARLAVKEQYAAAPGPVKALVDHMVDEQFDKANVYIRGFAGQAYDAIMQQDPQTADPMTPARATLDGLRQQVLDSPFANDLNLIEKLTSPAPDPHPICPLIEEGTDAPDQIDPVIEIPLAKLNGSSFLSVLGKGGDDHLAGHEGKDLIDGGSGADVMVGRGGDDVYVVDNKSDVVKEAAGGGSDLVISSISLTLSAELENLQLAGTGPTSGTGNQLDNDIAGNAGANILHGGAGLDALDGKQGVDQLLGDAGGDTLHGGAGNDRLTGGGGADRIFGDAGRDTFVFAGLAESGKTVATRDVIGDFLRGADRIDLSAIDAKSGAGNDKFTFIGTHAFHAGVKGELRFEKATGGGLDVYADVNGDARADFTLHLDKLAALSAADFLL